MMEVNKSVEDLSSICAKISHNYQIAECYDLEKSYEKVRQQLQSWAQMIEKESKVVYNTFPKFFRYNIIENKSYLEIFKNRAELREKVKNAEQTLAGKKDKLFKEKDIKKWGLRKEDELQIGQFLDDREKAFKVMLH